MPPTLDEIFARLCAPFPTSEVQWKAGRISDCGTLTTPIPFVTSRAIQRRLDEVVGPMNWKNTFSEVVTGPRISAIRCALSVRVQGEWNTKEDGAHVDASGSRIEFIIKGAYSDALKRAAVHWGIGRYLYNLNMPQVLCTQLGKGNNSFIRLDELPILPPDFVPEVERDETQKAWDAWHSVIKDRETAIAARQAELAANTDATEASAMEKVEQIANNTRTTHLPTTDAFSLREKLIPQNAPAQVPAGAEPQSVESLLGSTAASRTAVPKPTGAVVASSPAFEGEQQTSSTPESNEAAPSTESTSASCSLAEPPMPQTQDATLGGAVIDSSSRELNRDSTVAEDLAPHAECSVDPASSTQDTESQTGQASTSDEVKNESTITDPAKPSSATRVVSQRVQGDSLLADCHYALAPEDDWKTFHEILTKIRTPHARVALLGRFIDAPRNHESLTDAARAYLKSEVERLSGKQQTLG